MVVLWLFLINLIFPFGHEDTLAEFVFLFLDILNLLLKMLLLLFLELLKVLLQCLFISLLVEHGVLGIQEDGIVFVQLMVRVIIHQY